MNVENNWQEEKRSAYLYSVMAANEKNPQHKKLFFQLNLAAEKQACAWEKKMHEQEIPVPHEFVLNMRTRLVTWLIKHVGTEGMHGVLSAMKIRGMSVFKQHHNEHEHTSFNAASNIRAAVFGINDGLISNMSLILGIAGANANQHFIVLAGVAGLLAGACSMGAGEYISVRSQREVFEYQIAIEREELQEYPEEEAEELSLIYQARGMTTEDANKLANLMISNPETGLQTLAREELGLNPESLISPTAAMLFSFFSFSIGAALPLIPFLLGNSSWNIFASMGITGISLFVIGAILSLFTNRSPLLLGLRMLLVGVVAGLLTFTIGKWLGISIA